MRTKQSERMTSSAKKDFGIELKGVAKIFLIQQGKTDVKIYSMMMTKKILGNVKATAGFDTAGNFVA